jgi:hypothetical protein
MEVLYCFEKFGTVLIDDGFDIEVVDVIFVKEQIPEEYLANNTKNFNGKIEFEGELLYLLWRRLRRLCFRHTLNPPRAGPAQLQR